jgi:hypothetical protein
MLSLPRYLLGVAELSLLIGSAWIGASVLRKRLAPELDGAPGHLATAVLAFALLLLVAELLGSFGLFEAVPYLLMLVGIGIGTLVFGRGSWHRGGVLSAALRAAPGEGTEAPAGTGPRPPQPTGSARSPHPGATRGEGVSVLTAIALAVAAIAVVGFALEVKPHLSTGMTGFDSTWYHAPFAAGFFQSGDTWGLHFIAPQFLAWFYPANSEIFHAIGMGAFDRDVLSPLLNLGWFVGCLVAVWCIGRPYKVAPVSLALGAVALSLPALSDQAGEARNDIVGIFFLLAAVAIAVNAWAAGRSPASVHGEGRRLSLGVVAVVGLAAGLAAGTKLNFLLPAAVLVIGLAVIAPRGGRGRAFGVAGLAALVGGGYWYLRNLIHTGNPLPWIKHLGPIELPAPEQALGGREGHSVFGYLTDGTVWSDWFLPGLHDGLMILWPLLLAAAVTGLLRSLGRRSDPVLRLAGLVGLAAALAWLIAPTSASGPEGMPRGFESGLRYLAPALVLGLALLPTDPQLRDRLTLLRVSSHFVSHGLTNRELTRRLAALGSLAVLVAVALGYPVQRHYLANRYKNPTFTAPGLNAAFAWAQGVTAARIATTSTRQYPLFGPDLSNHVQYVGLEQPHAGFTAPTTCRTWRTLLNAGNYDYAVTSRDRIEPGKPPYPATARWTKAPSATVVLQEPPTIVYKLKGPLDPAACRR